MSRYIFRVPSAQLRRDRKDESTLSYIHLLHSKRLTFQPAFLPFAAAQRAFIALEIFRR